MPQETPACRLHFFSLFIATLPIVRSSWASPHQHQQHKDACDRVRVKGGMEYLPSSLAEAIPALKETMQTAREVFTIVGTIVGDLPSIYSEVLKAEGKAPTQLLRESKFTSMALRGERAELVHTVTATQADLSTTKETLSKVEGEKEELCCNVEQLKETVTATQSDLSSTKDILTKVEGEKEELCGKVQQLKDTVTATESDLSLTKTTLLQVEGEKATLRAAVTATQAQLATAKDTLTKVEGENNKLSATVTAKGEELRAMQTTLTKVEGERVKLMAEVGARTEEIKAEKDAKSTLEGELKQALAMLEQTKVDLDQETRQRIQFEQDAAAHQLKVKQLEGQVGRQEATINELSTIVEDNKTVKAQLLDCRNIIHVLQARVEEYDEESTDKVATGHNRAELVEADAAWYKARNDELHDVINKLEIEVSDLKTKTHKLELAVDEANAAATEAHMMLDRVTAQLRLNDKELKEALSQLDDMLDKSTSSGDFGAEKDDAKLINNNVDKQESVGKHTETNNNDGR